MKSFCVRSRNGWSRWLAVLPILLLSLDGAPLAARDAYVLISGGGTPLTNNYSQYLQAQAIAAFFERSYPAESTWVFYGAGNRPDEQAIIADTRRQHKQDGLILESWLPGHLPGNRPATRESILTTLREEILPAVAEGGTLYLFVGDHGQISRGEPKESAITLWQLKRDSTHSDTGWSTDTTEVLGVTELQAALREGLGQGRVVFCMTQCHSGGFHFLGMPRTPTPNSAWLTSGTSEAATRPEESADLPLPLVAGFTATDEASLAAGCDPDPDPDRWAGYERFLPENLLGLDLFTREPAGERRDSIAAAHEQAVLVNRTIDKPRASSEQYLEGWAGLIESWLAAEDKVIPEIRPHLEAYRRVLDTGLVEGSDAGLRDRAAQFTRFITRLTEQNTAVSDLLVNGTRADLETAMGPASSRPGRQGGRNRRAPRAELLKAWNEVLRPAWKAAVLAGEIADLPEAALAFEKRLLELEDNGRQFMLYRGWQNPLLNEIFWNSSYAFPGQFNAARAEAVTRWGAERRERVQAWGAQSTDETVRDAAAALARSSSGRRSTEPSPPQAETAPGKPSANASLRPLSSRTAAERTLFYRRVLAAWDFLLAADDRAALSQLQALIALERTPLP